MLIDQGGIVGLKQAAKLVSRKTSQNLAVARKDLRFQQEERNIRNILSSRAEANGDFSYGPFFSRHEVSFNFILIRKNENLRNTV